MSAMAQGTAAPLCFIVSVCSRQERGRGNRCHWIASNIFYGREERKLAKYVVKRVLLAVVTMFLICFITFFTMNAIPGGPFNGEKAKSEAVMQALNARYGLDKPVEVQFANYMKNLFHGDFGISLKTGRSISQTIFESFRVSAKLGLMAVLVALICGIVLGCVAALNRNKWPDHIIIFFVTLFTAMPSFVAASFLLLVFCIQLGWVPVWSTSNPNYVLPVIALSLSPMAYITRLTKTSMLDVLGQDYVRTARAKGVHPWKVIFVHSLRNALIPVILCRTPDRRHPDRISCCREDLYHRRTWLQIRGFDYQPRLSDDYGHHNFPCIHHDSHESDQRPCVQAG